MVIKKMARKDRSFSQLMNYIEKGSFEPAILYNLPFYSEKPRLLAEFEENAKLIKQRKNGNYFYHEVLSFAPDDSGKLNFNILEDLTFRYLDLRTKGKGLACAGVHWGKNPHVHIMLAANELGSSRKLHSGRAEFLRLGREMERYQKAKYPFLNHSLVRGSSGRFRTIQKTRGESELGRRLKAGDQTGSKTEAQTGETEKQRVRRLFDQCLHRSDSMENLIRLLSGEGLELYQRGQILGVLEAKSQRKYRLKTLGVLAELERCVETWERVARRGREIERLRKTQNIKNREKKLQNTKNRKHKITRCVIF